jgi:hypothetical protein
LQKEIWTALNGTGIRFRTIRLNGRRWRSGNKHLK